LNVQEAEYLRLLGFPPGINWTSAPPELADGRPMYRKWSPGFSPRSAAGSIIIDHTIFLGDHEFFPNA